MVFIILVVFWSLNLQKLTILQLTLLKISRDILDID